jgi:hypothetical protein
MRCGWAAVRAGKWNSVWVSLAGKALIAIGLVLVIGKIWKR